MATKDTEIADLEKTLSEERTAHDAALANALQNSNGATERQKWVEAVVDVFGAERDVVQELADQGSLVEMLRTLSAPEASA